VAKKVVGDKATAEKATADKATTDKAATDQAVAKEAATKGAVEVEAVKKAAGESTGTCPPLVLEVGSKRATPPTKRLRGVWRPRYVE
jgi:hypothetical protein